MAPRDRVAWSVARRGPAAVPALALLLVALLLAGLGGAPASAAPAGRAPRLGLFHPRPRLCLAEEPSQRDLRVLRLAFGVSRVPPERLGWPWFLRPAPGPGGPGLAVALDSDALWGLSPVRLAGAHPDFAPSRAADRLAAWRGWVAQRLPAARAADLPSLAQLVGPGARQDPFFPSRLAQSRLLPFQLGRNGSRPEDVCRSWPAGVSLEPGDERHPYVLRSERGQGGGPFQLAAYRERRELWRDYLYGRLDAVLLEGADFDGELERLRASQLGNWGLLAGTQQIVLRLAPALAEALGQEGRLALSLALPRAELAQVDGPGRFLPARTFLAPIQSAGGAERAEGLAWDSLRARRLWLQRPRPLPELRLAVLAHPVLDALAQRIQAHWSRTLNLNLRVQTWPFDQFDRLLADGEADLLLDVVDLDDGSLQDLWLESLRALRAPLAAGPARWEAALDKALPYLPLVGNLHAVLLRRDAPEELLPRVCPGCVPALSPRRLAPEPVERDSPQG